MNANNYSGNRGLGFIIDWLIWWAVGAVIMSMMSENAGLFVILIATPAYWLLKEKITKTGSLGKLLCGLKVIDYQTKNTISLIQSAKRGLSLIAIIYVLIIVSIALENVKAQDVGGAPVVGAIVGVVTTAFIMHCQGLSTGDGRSRSDLWANTIVLKRNAK